MIGPLVETDWLEGRLGDDNLRLVDGSWYLPAMDRDAAAEFAAAHIPGAVYFDIDTISDSRTPLPHMLPSPEDFAASVEALGISDTDLIVVYDGAGLFSAARVWWMFRAMGAANVAVLNGGLKAWRAENRTLETPITQPPPGNFAAQLQLGWVTDLEAVTASSRGASVAIVDARPAPRFQGAAPEPRAGLRSGHIPGSCNMPIDIFLQNDGRLKPPDDLRAAFTAAGVDLARPVITTCGSGVTAAIPFLALAVLGKSDAALYDGAWAEWGGLAETPVETG